MKTAARNLKNALLRLLSPFRKPTRTQNGSGMTADEFVARFKVYEISDFKRTPQAGEGVLPSAFTVHLKGADTSPDVMLLFRSIVPTRAGIDPMNSGCYSKPRSITPVLTRCTNRSMANMRSAHSRHSVTCCSIPARVGVSFNWPR